MGGKKGKEIEGGWVVGAYHSIHNQTPKEKLYARRTENPMHMDGMVMEDEWLHA